MNGQQCCYDLSACTSMQNSNYSVKERLGLHRINLIHFVISTCIHSDYIFIYLCLLYSCYGYYSEPLLSTRCPLHSPVHTCAGANCSNYLDISYLRWRAGDQAAAEPIATSAANRLIGKVVQSRRRPLLGPSPG